MPVFDVAEVRDARVADIVADVDLARGTLRTLAQHLQERPTVYLPSHDPTSAERLRSMEVTTL